MNNQFFDEEFQKNLFQSFNSPIFKPQTEPFFLVASKNSPPKGIKKKPGRMKEQFRPNNLNIRFSNSSKFGNSNGGTDQDGGNGSLGYEITGSGNFVSENFKIGNTGIMHGLTQFQSQSLDEDGDVEMKDQERTFSQSISLTQVYSVDNLFKVPRAPASDRKTKKKKKSMKLEDLEKVKLLGTGASSRVLLMRSTKTSDLFANKVIKIDPGFQPKIIKDEIESLYRCRRSEYVISFKDAFYQKNVNEIHIILEYMNANSVGNLFRKCNTLGTEICSIIAYCVLKGLTVLHKKKIIHRDIKPDNVLVNKDGYVKVSDFGLTGRSKKGFSLRERLVFNSIKGTLLYMSPERIKEENYGFNSDIWSLGVMLFELRSGRFPFPHKGNYFDLLDEVNNLQPESLFLSNDLFSPVFQKFIRQCLVMDPAKRLGAKEMMNHDFVKKWDRVSASEREKIVRSWLDEFVDI